MVAAVLLMLLRCVFKFVSGKCMLELSVSSFFIFGGRPKRGATSQSLDRLGLPTLPLRTGGVAVFAANDDFANL